MADDQVFSETIEMRLQPLPDKWNTGMEMNLAWKREQAKNADTKARIAPPAAKPEPILNQDTPEECRNCTVAKKCKIIMRKWYVHTPRPDLVRAWVHLTDEHAREMVCLSGLQEG